MHTPWGDLRIADAHVHFFSAKFFSTLAMQTGDASADVPAALGWEPPDADPAVFARRWVAELDRNGVERASLIASVPGDEDSVAAAVAVLEAVVDAGLPRRCRRGSVDRHQRHARNRNRRSQPVDSAHFRSPVVRSPSA